MTTILILNKILNKKINLEKKVFKKRNKIIIYQKCWKIQRETLNIVIFIQ